MQRRNAPVSVSMIKANLTLAEDIIYRPPPISPAFAGRNASVAKIASAIKASPKKIGFPVSIGLSPRLKKQCLLERLAQFCLHLILSTPSAVNNLTV